ncbi:DNA helicase UvrD [Candidatus Woesearchaeota archaeon]|jgi:uncharacterized protein (TIGR00375 family)|nr:DNA helicase UvrD [Candidatus Woesearchaeota archaeon]MBT6519401.1 DNA helicase UvrD [Candidatus Woesearchaeota archaeon]MBT7368073.1 DNA helicase UvrD [Candidatus Woesearchaeota archaeon]
MENKEEAKLTRTNIVSKNQIISDLHIHSKYSRGCSTNLDIDNLEKYAKIKGVDLLGTGDFTHPIWQKELKKKLINNDNTQIPTTKSGFPFLYQTELSLIYSSNGKGRRIHNVVLAPSFDVVNQITDELKKRGRVDYDGRPIFKIPCPEFVEMLRSISKDIEVIPAHIWTPHFSLFGEYNQFNTVEECFEDQTKHIHALETGLSSDPPMNWRVSAIDRFNLVSFSDCHSYWPWRIGRESTIFNVKKLTYKNILSAIRTPFTKGKKEGNFISETIEVNPSYGKYHLNGHRKCDVCLDPQKSKSLGHICPQCKKPVTIGVLQRVEELLDPSRPEGYKLKDAHPFRTLIPLHEILSNLLNKGLATKTVWTEYNNISKLGSEFDILLNKSKEELLQVCHEKIANAILKNRTGQIEVKPGFDGEYGVPLFNASEKILEVNKQKTPDKQKLQKKQKSLANF